MRKLPPGMKAARHREASRKYAAKHREEKKEYNTSYLEEHREENKETCKAYYYANREEALRKRAEYRETNAEAVKACKWASYLKSKYGLTVQEWQDMLSEQGGVCAICGEVQENRSLCVDHNHETGDVRGLLCVRCNAGIGNFREKPDLFLNAIAYLERHV